MTTGRIYFLLLKEFYMFRINESTCTLTPAGVYPILKNDTFFGKRRKVTENTLVFLTMLSLRLNDRRDKAWAETDEEFQEISTELIIKILARDNYRSILSRLVELDIIEINPSYLANQFCKGYRIHPRFAHVELVARQIKYEQVKKRIELMNIYFAGKSLRSYPYLIPQYHNLQKIHIDYERATAWIEAHRDLLDQNNERIIGNADSYHQQALKIHRGFSHKMSVSDTNYRLHSSMTGFPKKLRTFLNVIDEGTDEVLNRKVTIDGCNTQPVMICLRMESEGLAPDADFREWCLEGTIYQHISSELGETKNWVKTRFMDTILFTCGNGSYTQGMKNPTGENIHKQKFSRYFKKRFPRVYYWLLQTKKQLNDSENNGVSTKKRNAGGSALSLIIQRMESHLWIHTLLAELPDDLLYVTLHDAVMLFSPTDEQIKFVEKKIKEVGFRLYGVDIPLKTEVV